MATGLGTTRKTLSAIINGKQSVSPEMAVRLGVAFANTTPEFWLTVQGNHDLAQARQKIDTSNVTIFGSRQDFFSNTLNLDEQVGMKNFDSRTCILASSLGSLLQLTPT